MNVLQSNPKIMRIANAMIGKPTLPDRCLRRHSMREAAFNEPHDPFDGCSFRSYQKMEMIWHDNECMQSVVSVTPVLLQCFQKQGSIRLNLEQTSPIPRRAGRKVCPGALGTRRTGHSEILRARDHSHHHPPDHHVSKKTVSHLKPHVERDLRHGLSRALP